MKNNKFINWICIELLVNCSLIHSLLLNGQTRFKNLAVFTPQVCLAIFQPLRKRKKIPQAAIHKCSTEYVLRKV